MPAPLEEYLLTPLETLAAASQPFDAVVVGGGTAGLSAARAFVEAGKNVAVLEAGPLALLTHSSTTDLRFDNDGLTRFRQLIEYSPRNASGERFGVLNRCLGGRALFWNGAAPRFAATDFAAWPIDLDDLAPFYDWAERDFRVTTHLGLGTLGQKVIARLEQAGLPAEPGPYAVDVRPTENGWLGGTVGNPLASLLRTNMLTQSEPRLHIAGHSFATHVLRDNRGLATAVVAVDDTNTEREIPARSVVLAAGGFESVRLAMASHLPDASGRMGRGVVDHLFCRAYYPVPESLYDATSPEAAVVAVRSGNGRAFQLEIHMPRDDLFTFNEYSQWQPTRTLQYAAMVRGFAPVEPRDDNHIEVGPSATPGDYTVHLDYSAADRSVLEAMIEGLDSVRAALDADPAERVQTFPAGASHHEGGGLAMGADPETSVTDPFGRIHGVPNVVVVDAASWPTVSAANPCLTITALARRQSQRLAADLSS